MGGGYSFGCNAEKQTFRGECKEERDCWSSSRETITVSAMHLTDINRCICDYN